MKKFIPFYILCFSGLVVLFLWEEWDHLSIYKPINAQKFAAFGTMLATIFTAISVYLLFKQNQLQIENRIAANQPDIYPCEMNLKTEDHPYNFQPNPDPDPLFDFLKNQKKPFFKSVNTKDTEIEERDFAYLSLNNIGLGAAKSIKISWIYDQNEVSNFIKDIYPFMATMLATSQSDSIDFLSANSSIDIKFPSHFLYCCGKYLNDFDQKGKQIQKPSLILQLAFLDIYNNVYVKNFKVDFDCVFTEIKIMFKQF